MLGRLKPGLAAYSRISYGRELLGHNAGAIEAMHLAVDAATGEREPSAWTRWQLGKLYWSTGRIAAAEHEYRTALATFPGYVYALDALAQVEAAHGHLAQALELEQQSRRRDPSAAVRRAARRLLASRGRPGGCSGSTG